MYTTFKQFISEAKITANKAAELFVFGGCLSFAIALQQKIGGELFVISHDGKKLHAFVRTKDGDFDVKGKRTTFQMTRDFSSSWEGWTVDGLFKPEEIPFKNLPKMIDKATQYINDNPPLFKV
jgi:hypothetical protein